MMPGSRSRPFLPATTILLALLAVVIFVQQKLWQQAQVSGPKPPNLLLITIDTLRADELGAYGSPHGHSPVLDRLARRSTLYSMAIAPAPWTLPSIGAIMTGLEPAEHGAIHFRKPLPEAPTLAEKLRASGYHTSAAVTHFLVGPDYGFDRGFERFEQRLIPASDDEAHLSITSRELTDIGIELLNETREPAFVWLHYFDPHFHYMEHPPATRATDPGRHGRKLYRGEIGFTDAEIGRLLDAADALPRPPVVLLTSDHGEQFYEHGSLHHTTAVYQEVVAVPLLVARSLGGGGDIVQAPTRILDAHGLLLQAAGAVQPGRPTSLEPPVLVHSEQASNLRALVAGRYKVIADLGRGRVELYDLVADPAERLNLAAEQPELLERMCASLSGHFAELERAGQALRDEREVEISQEREDQLAALGYVGGPTGGPETAGRDLCAAALGR
jgi:choline-sulfatase